MLLTRFRIGQRLALVFGLVITVFLVMAGAASSSIHSLSGQMALLVGGRYENTVLANQLKAEIGDASRSMPAVLVMTDEAQTRKELAVIDGIMKKHSVTLQRPAALPSDEAVAAQLKELTALRDKFVPAQAGFVKLVAEGNKDDALVKYMFSVRGVQTKYLATLDAFVATQHKLMGEASQA